jgi:hypothetical protein
MTERDGYKKTLKIALYLDALLLDATTEKFSRHLEAAGIDPLMQEFITLYTKKLMEIKAKKVTDTGGTWNAAVAAETASAIFTLGYMARANVELDESMQKSSNVPFDPQSKEPQA